MRADVRATRADTARRELEDRVSAVLEDAMEQATSPYAASSAASSGPSGTAEETDLLLRLPHGVLEGFSIFCSAACSRECRRRGNVDKSDLSALVITCDCLDVFDELRLVSQDTPRAHAAAAQHAAWADAALGCNPVDVVDQLAEPKDVTLAREERGGAVAARDTRDGRPD